MTILGIETSCDETALSLIETRGEGEDFECRVINSLVHSQAELHSPYGGVFPNLAKREHLKNLPILLDKIMTNAPKIDMIAVTEGPGLEPALWTGITFAEELSKKWSVPILPINHMEGHIVGSLLLSMDKEWHKLKPLPLPSIALLISGGHTELVKINKIGSYEIVGQTKDDAVGEAFDKAARILGLPYPGGPHLSKLAREYDNKKPTVTLPRPMINSKDLNFSFSGLKTAVLYAVRDATKEGRFDDSFKKEIAFEFESAVADTLDSKLRGGIEKIGAQSVIVGGGVSANQRLRARFTKTAEEYGIPVYLPSQHVSGDNALMIALAGALDKSGATRRELRAHGTKKLG